MCGANYHPSCATRAESNNSAKIFACCENKKKSEVSSQKETIISDKTKNFLDMDEKKLKSVIKDTFQQLFKPVENKIDKKFDNLERSVKFMSDSFEEQKEKFNDILKEVKALRKENEYLKQRLQLMEAKFDDMEVQKRANNIIVTGVPKQTDMNTDNIVCKILSAINIQKGKTDVLESFRLNKKDNGPILVKFGNIQTKKEVLRSIKQVKGTTVARCGLEGDNGKIYLNEDLPVGKRNLFKKAREIKKDKGYKAAFCTNGIVYLKIDENDPPIKIRSEKDFPM